MTQKNLNLSTYLENLKSNNCTLCPLGCTQNKTIVTHKGNLNADICIVGMGPGKGEQRKGLPFVGPAGKLADEMIKYMGFNPLDLFWTNVVLHRTTENINGAIEYKDRAPTKEESRACSVHVKQILKNLNPKIIIAFGKPTLEGLLEIEIESGWIKNICGNIFMYENIPVFAMLHPAYILRNPSMKEKAKEDCNVFLQKYKEMV